MGLTGRYDFKGIQRAVTTGINALLITTSWGAWLLASPFNLVIQALENAAVNWLANRGLIVLNVGAIIIDGAIDQSALDSAIGTALQQLQTGNVTPSEGKAIDDSIRQAFDKAADVGATNADPTGMPDV